MVSMYNALMPFVRGGAYPNGSFSAKTFFEKSLEREDDDVRGSGDRKKASTRLQVSDFCFITLSSSLLSFI